MRRIDLAESVLLTASGITRLLDGLERAGFVEKGACASDARVSYARLTARGRGKLREAAVTHLAGVEELFTGRYSDEELETLGRAALAAAHDRAATTTARPARSSRSGPAARRADLVGQRDLGEQHAAVAVLAEGVLVPHVAVDRRASPTP